MDSESHQPRDGWKPTERSTCSTLDIHRATRDSSTGQFHKHDGDSTGIRHIHSPYLSICCKKLGDWLYTPDSHQTSKKLDGAIGHAIHEVVSLHRCRCGQSYEQWGSQPNTPCPTCEKIYLKNTGPGKRTRENDKITDRTPEVNIVIPPPGPTPRHGSNSRQDYTPKLADKRSCPEHMLPKCHDPMSWGNRRGKSSSSLNQQVYNNTGQTHDLY